MLRVVAKGRRRLPETRRGRLATLLALVGVAALGALVARSGIVGVDLPDWLDGGRSDEAPRGDVLYEGQEARTASERFLIDIGDGEAVVAVKARQNHDRHGWWLNGDFQSTNGTSSVADPDDRDVPARLVVTMDYCAEGTISVERDPGEAAPRRVTFDMGEVFVCGATLGHSPANDAAFRQDDTPADFHGDFVSFVAGAVEATAAAAECPADELERYATGDYLAFARTRLAEQMGLPESAVEVVPGTVGHTDEEAQEALQERLDSYANLRDPDDPDRTWPALSISYLSSTGSAVEDSCWREPGGRDLDTLDGVDVPPPDGR